MEYEKAIVFDLAKSVEYSDNATVSKMVIKKQTGNITLFAFDKDQSLSEHSAPFDAFVQVTEGKGRIIIDRKPMTWLPVSLLSCPPTFPMQFRQWRNSR